MVPTLFARFFTSGPTLYDKAKEVALAQGYAVSVDDPEKGMLHLHKKESGKMVHLVIFMGGKSDRSIAVEVKPGDEGSYMDHGREFIDGLRKAVR
jgi:hypothetical protein